MKTKNNQNPLDYSDINPIFLRQVSLLETDNGTLYKENVELKESVFELKAVIRKYEQMFDLLDRSQAQSD